MDLEKAIGFVALSWLIASFLLMTRSILSILGIGAIVASLVFAMRRAA